MFLMTGGMLTGTAAASAAASATAPPATLAFFSKDSFMRLLAFISRFSLLFSSFQNRRLALSHMFGVILPAAFPAAAAAAAAAAIFPFALLGRPLGGQFFL
ncbi:MAG TPA: hypothetical protein VJM79_03725, partial [Rhizorhapis sp.]|nr:hypothetical protein [Rhizorhapis sp.]